MKQLRELVIEVFGWLLRSRTAAEFGAKGTMLFLAIYVPVATVYLLAAWIWKMATE